MTPRERVLASLDHKEPDRVPLDLGATPSSGISIIAYNRLTRFLGVSDRPGRIYDVVQQLAQPDDGVVDRLGVDVLDIGRTFNTRDSDWHPVTLSDGSAAEYPRWFAPRKEADGSFSAMNAEGARIACMPAGATFFDQTCFPYVDGYPADYRGLQAAMAKVHWSALAHSPWDNAGDPVFWSRLRENALALRKSYRQGAHDRLRLQPLRVGHVPAPAGQFPDGHLQRPGGGGETPRCPHGGAPCHAGESVLRCWRCRGCAALWRRPGLRRRSLHGAGNLPQALQTPACRVVRLREEAQRHAHVPPFLRWDRRRLSRT